MGIRDDLEAAARLVEQAGYQPTEPVAISRDEALERIEANVRRCMAAVTESRGFDSQRVRDDDLACIDVLLDRYNELSG